MKRLNVVVGLLGAVMVSLSLVPLIPQGAWSALVGLSLGSVLVYASLTSNIIDEK
jgi:predicted small integral membrane protein